MAVVRFFVGVGVEVVMCEVAEALSSALEDEVVLKAGIMINVEDGGAVVGGLDGRIMTNLNATETPRSTLSLSGVCWRRLISIGLQN